MFQWQKDREREIGLEYKSLNWVWQLQSHQCAERLSPDRFKRSSKRSCWRERDTESTLSRQTKCVPVDTINQTIDGDGEKCWEFPTQNRKDDWNSELFTGGADLILFIGWSDIKFYTFFFIKIWLLLPAPISSYFYPPDQNLRKQRVTQCLTNCVTFAENDRYVACTCIV